MQDTDTRVELEFAFNPEAGRAALCTVGLTDLDLPELYLVAEPGLARLMLDTRTGDPTALLVARGMLELAGDLIRSGDAGAVPPRRVTEEGRSAVVGLGAEHTPDDESVSLLTDGAPRVCSMTVEEWAEA